MESVDKVVDACLALQTQTDEMRGEMQQSLESMRQALCLAFCTDPDLVNGGYAKEIARVLEGNDETNV